MTFEESLAGKNVLFVQRSAHRDGSAVSGLMAVKTLIDAGASVQVCFGHDGAVIEDYRDSGCECVVVPHGDWLRPGGILKTVRRLIREWIIGNSLAKRVSSSKIDLIYVNSIVSLSGAVAAKKLAVPCVWHLREMFSDVGGEMYAPAFGGRKLVRSLLRNLSDKIVVNSVAVADNVFGPRFREELVVIPNAISDGESHGQSVSRNFREELGIHSKTCLLAVIANARPVKGHLFFLRVVSKLVMLGQDFAVVFAGDFSNEYGEYLSSEIEDLGLGKHVYLVGDVPDIRLVYRCTDLVCIPSRSESFGRVAIEAFRNKIPVVATAVGGLREIVRHEENGLLVEYGDVLGMVESVERLVQDQIFRRSCVKEAYLDATNIYSANSYARRTKRVVLNALKNKKVKQDYDA